MAFFQLTKCTRNVYIFIFITTCIAMWGMKAMFLYLLNYPVHVIPWYLNASHYFDEIKTLFFFFLVCVCVCCWDSNQNAHLNKHQLTLWPSIQGRCRAAIFNCILKQILLTSLDPIFSYVKWKRIGQQKKRIHGKPMVDACEERMTKNLIKMMQSHDVNFTETNI